MILTDGAFHPVDSSAIAFEIAAKAAYRQSMPKARPQILEPIMKVDVFTPEDYMGDVIGDLNRRRGIIKSQEPGATGVRIKADAPLSEMFGYIGDLRTMTSGRGQFSMEFSHYAPCPSNVAEEVIKEAKERQEAPRLNQVQLEIWSFLSGKTPLSALDKGEILSAAGITQPCVFSGIVQRPFRLEKGRFILLIS